MVSRLHIFNETKIDISRSQYLLKEQLNLIVSSEFLAHQNVLEFSAFQLNSRSSAPTVNKTSLSPAQKNRRRRYKQKRSHRKKCPDQYQQLSSNLCGPLTVEPQTDIELSDSDDSVDIKITSPITIFVNDSAEILEKGGVMETRTDLFSATISKVDSKLSCDLQPDLTVA
jgi:hypothetical protein